MHVYTYQKYTRIHKVAFQMFGYFVIFLNYYRHCVVMSSNHKPWEMQISIILPMRTLVVLWSLGRDRLPVRHRLA